MNFSKRETFFWLKGAVLLDKSAKLLKPLDSFCEDGQAKFWAGEIPREFESMLTEGFCPCDAPNPKDILDYCKVRQSRDLAQNICIRLARRQLSIDDLEGGANQTGKLKVGTLRVDAKKYALAHVGATGNTDSRVVSYALDQGIITDADVRRAKRKRQRHPSFEPSRISGIARFLVDNWCGPCGQTGHYCMYKDRFETTYRDLSEEVGVICGTNGNYVCKKRPQFFFTPPLCFFSNGALAQYGAFALNRDGATDESTSSQAIRKWVSRLKLKHATRPKIRDVKINGDEIYFRQ